MDENLKQFFKINQTLNPKPSFLIGRTKAFWQKVSITENLETATSTESILFHIRLRTATERTLNSEVSCQNVL